MKVKKQRVRRTYIALASLLFLGFSGFALYLSGRYLVESYYETGEHENWGSVTEHCTSNDVDWYFTARVRCNLGDDAACTHAVKVDTEKKVVPPLAVSDQCLTALEAAHPLSKESISSMADELLYPPAELEFSDDK